MKNKDLKRIMMYSGWIICLVQLLISIILEVMIIKMNLLPLKYVFFIGIALVIIDVIFAVTQKWLIPGIVTKGISVILCVVMVVGCLYVNATDSTISKITGVTTKIDNINVYVLKEDKANKIVDAKDYKFGILTELDRANTDTVVKEWDEELGKKIDTAEYDGVTDLVDSLYNHDVQAIILNTAYIGVITEQEGFEDFNSKVKSISYKDIESQVKSEDSTKGENETEDPYKEYQNYLYNGDDVFTIYVSGIDTTGSPSVNRNSDVNILMTVNTNTRQILMISTPRDFYVPLSISNGVKDKLTHAGCYGIDVSVNTLEMLYGVNIDHYIKVNFSGFKKIINALDGIDVYSEYAFSAGEGFSYVKGINYLNGDDALAFARARHAFASGDRQRGKNQMAVIEAVINKMVSSSMLINYTSVLSALSDSMVTNMSYDEISDLVKMQLSNMSEWDIVRYSVDGTGDNQLTYSLNFKTYVMVPNQSTVDRAKSFLADIYNNKVVTE